MKIGLDLRMLGGGSGISRYIHELSLEVLKADKTNQYVLFFYELTDELRNEYGPFGHKMVETKIRHYSFDEQFRLPKILYAEKLDLVHFPHFNVPILYARPFVVTIHDLTHTKFPGRKKSRIIHRLAYNLVLMNAVRRAKRIISVSNTTKSEILKHFKLDGGKITTIYEAVNEYYGVLDRESAFEQVHNRFGITKPFILYVGVWRRYKNLPNLALAFDKLRKQNLDFELVLAGDEDPFYPEIKQRVFRINNNADIKALGRVSDKDLKDLYNACSLFVLPSLYEGFGLIALEAAACGAPIACSDIPTLREVIGQAAEYFDPNNPDNMADVMRAVLTDPTRSEELANLALARTRHFSWKIAAEETIKVYNSI